MLLFCEWWFSNSPESKFCNFQTLKYKNDLIFEFYAPIPQSKVISIVYKAIASSSCSQNVKMTKWPLARVQVSREQISIFDLTRLVQFVSLVFLCVFPSTCITIPEWNVRFYGKWVLLRFSVRFSVLMPFSQQSDNQSKIQVYPDDVQVMSYVWYQFGSILSSGHLHACKCPEAENLEFCRTDLCRF